MKVVLEIGYQVGLTKGVVDLPVVLEHPEPSFRIPRQVYVVDTSADAVIVDELVGEFAVLPIALAQLIIAAEIRLLGVLGVMLGRVLLGGVLLVRVN